MRAARPPPLNTCRPWLAMAAWLLRTATRYASFVPDGGAVPPTQVGKSGRHRRIMAHHPCPLDGSRLGRPAHWLALALCWRRGRRRQRFPMYDLMACLKCWSNRTICWVLHSQVRATAGWPFREPGLIKPLLSLRGVPIAVRRCASHVFRQDSELYL